MHWPRFIVVLLLAILASGSALVHRSHMHAHRHARAGVVISSPASAWHYRSPDLYPYSDGYSYQYPYPPVVVIPSPPVYIEQNAGTPAGEEQQHWWYYCQRAQAYYPYVKECPQGWQRVAPQPPDLR